MGGPGMLGTRNETAGDQSRWARLRTHAGEAGQGLGHAMLSGSRLLGELVTMSPVALLLAVAALGAWWYEHDQHLRQAGELHQLKKQTDADISRLQSDAAAATQEANRQHADQVVQLELQRQKSERDQGALRQRLLTLQDQEHARAEQQAALPAPQVASELAARLGLASEDVAAKPTGPTAGGDPTVLPAGTIPALPVAGSSTVFPATPGTGRSDASARLAMGQASPPTPPGTETFSLSEAALRKMSGALDSLDACRQQAEVRDSLVSNCQAQVAADAAIVEQQKASIAKLNQALSDKDQILAKRGQEQQAELKVARGTFTGRVLHTLEHVAIGLVVGLILRH